MRRSKDAYIYEPTAYTHPYGYFLTQASLALWAVNRNISPNISHAFETYTACYRRITGGLQSQHCDAVWLKAMEEIETHGKHPLVMTSILWKHFTVNRQNLYQPPTDDSNHIGSFIYKLYGSRAELHYQVHRNSGEFRFCQVEARRAEMKQITKAIAEKSEHANIPITLGSWMNRIRSIRAVLPDDFLRSERVLGKERSWKGDSLWGQFIRGDGGAKKEEVQLFIRRLSGCKTLEEAVNAFPNQVTLLSGTTEMFYQHYKV